MSIASRPPSATACAGAARLKIAIITKLKDPNAGNEALSRCLLGFMQTVASDAEIRVIDRSWPLLRSLAAIDRTRLAADPDVAPLLFDRVVDELIARCGPDPAGPLTPRICDVSVAPPPEPPRRHPLMREARRLLRFRSRLAALGLVGREVLTAAANSLAWADLVIWNAAGEFYPTSDWNEALRMLVLLRAAQRLGARTMIVNHSLEPAGPVLERVIAHVYRDLDAAIVRGRRSFDKAVDIGVPRRRLHEAPDLAFLVSRGDFLAKLAVEPDPLAAGAIVVGINANAAPRAVDEWDRLFEGLSTFARPLVFASNHLADDLRFALPLARRHGIRLIDRQQGSAELIALLRPADLVIASRFHTALFALCSGVPTLTIEPGELKLVELTEQLGYPLPTVVPDSPGWSDRLLALAAQALEREEEIRVAGNLAVARQVERIETVYGAVLSRELDPAARSA